MHVICFLFDPNVGGPSIRARGVYSKMVADGHKVRIAFPRAEGSALEYMQEAGLEAERLPIAKPTLPRKPLPFLRFAFGAPVSLWRIVCYLRRHRPDVVHVNGAFDILPAIAARIAGCAVVWHLNDTLFGPSLSGYLGRLVVRVADVVIVAAERVGRHYGIPEDKWHVVHAPVDVDRFSAREPSARPFDPATVTLVGNWNWIKGQGSFVDVIAALQVAGHRVKGRIVGRFLDGQTDFWQPILDRIESDGLSDTIETPGFIADTPGVLAETDLLLLTSHSEASPIVVLEAMSVGLPVVTFDVGGVREQLGVPSGDGFDTPDGAGIVVGKGDTDAMAAACGRLLKDPAAWRRMAENGQRRARALFSLDACTLRHITAYEAAISARGTNSSKEVTSK